MQHYRAIFESHKYSAVIYFKLMTAFFCEDVFKAAAS